MISARCNRRGADWRRSVTRLQEPSATIAFKQKMTTWKKRKNKSTHDASQIAEFPHAWIKEAAGGLRQFRRAEVVWKAAMEATWACAQSIYNLTRWFRLRRTLRSTSSCRIVPRRRQKGVDASDAGSTSSMLSVFPPLPKAISSQLPVLSFPQFATSANDDPRGKPLEQLQDSCKGDCSGCGCGFRLRTNAENSVMPSPI